MAECQKKVASHSNVSPSVRWHKVQLANKNIFWKPAFQNVHSYLLTANRDHMLHWLLAHLVLQNLAPTYTSSTCGSSSWNCSKRRAMIIYSDLLICFRKERLITASDSASFSWHFKHQVSPSLNIGCDDLGCNAKRLECTKAPLIEAYICNKWHLIYLVTVTHPSPCTTGMQTLEGGSWQNMSLRLEKTSHSCYRRSEGILFSHSLRWRTTYISTG